MISLLQRRLNKRYYGVVVTPKVRVSIEFTGKKTIQLHAPLMDWLNRLTVQLQEFHNVPSEGGVTGTLTGNGYSVDGLIYVFDDQSLINAENIIRALYTILDDYPRDEEPFQVELNCSIKTVKIRFWPSGPEVNFKELDTEPIEKPTRVTTETTSSIMWN